MKKTITTIILGILLIGIVNASLVSFLSNTITGKISVEGPLFYLDSEDVINAPGKDYLSSQLNSPNRTAGDYFKLDDERFYSESLNVESFYPMNFVINLNVKAINLSEENGTKIPASIKVSVIRVNENGNMKETLCDTLFLGIDNEDKYEKYAFTCEGKDKNIIFDNSDRILLTLQDGSSFNSKINIKYEDSYVQVEPK
jgi:hypothetical protein